MGVVNYYHYSVYKLLVVNLTTRFARIWRHSKKKPASACVNAVEPVNQKADVTAKKSPDATPAAGLDRIPASAASPAT
ncbi:MAG: hypothetical protein EOO80_04995 [Oxalobacteraceae bacterium]|nr:MAG: hypothetical protein EOO80_04995 [Oxalobacteraceae bacterium]